MSIAEEMETRMSVVELQELDEVKGLLAKGKDAVFSHVENCKRAVLAAGLGERVKDEWLALLGFADFDLVNGFPQAKRQSLARMLDEMWPLMVRLDPGAAPSAPSSEPVPHDLVTTEVAVSEYHTSRTTIRRKVKAGELHDHRPPDAPANSKLLLSRAELGRVFARKK